MSVLPAGSARTVGSSTKLTTRSVKENPSTIPMATAMAERRSSLLKPSSRSSTEASGKSPSYEANLRDALDCEKGNNAIRRRVYVKRRNVPSELWLPGDVARTHVLASTRSPIGPTSIASYSVVVPVAAVAAGLCSDLGRNMSI